MFCESLQIPEVKVLRPDKHEDDRGFFSEVYSARNLAKHNVHIDIVQENFAFSKHINTVRGLHFQTPPFAHAKLVQVVAGSIFDVAVDLRKGSPWYGQYVHAELSYDNWNQIYIPAGFAHGLCTLEKNTAVMYRVDTFFSADHDTGIRWNDPTLDIKWPVSESDVRLSPKDQTLPLLEEFDTPFRYTGVEQ
ncbi:MAG: dTDP-4-dehydrorhamnose 3,5-epimerase [Gammaproteobacteria bacterium]